MIDPHSFKDLRLPGGFVIVEIEFTREPLLDAMGREAIAKTAIVGTSLTLLIRDGLSERELSVTFYHEILEAVTVGSSRPPAGVMEFNEADFERTACRMHDELGAASPENLNHMLQSCGFREG